MKTIRFLSRVAFICNISFALFVILNYFGATERHTAIPGTVEKIPFLKELIILLGFPAIIINFLMCLTYLVCYTTGRQKLIPIWLGFINLIFLIAQVYYFFFFHK